MKPIKITGLLLAGALMVACQTEKPKQEQAEKRIEKYSLTGKSATFYRTAKESGERLSEVGEGAFRELRQPTEMSPTIFVDPDRKFQEIVGIGGALTDAAAETFYKLPKEKQQEIITAYFDKDKGIGYSMARTSIHSSDFSSKSVAYAEVLGDTKLDNFSIEQDRKFRIPFIKEALKATEGDMKLFASPWSPPAWMKTTGNMLQGGKLKSEYRQAWADYYLKFIEEYKKEGINIWGLTVQNEPMSPQTWESCLYTAEEERDFVKNFLGPTIKQSKYPDTKLIIWDHNRGLMYQRAKVVYDDPEAAKYVWGTGYHWYAGDHFDNVRLHHEAFPDKNLLFTEGCVYPFNIDSLHLWKWGERYGKSILKDLDNGASGWVDWNVLLDETGGPNHVGNFCLAPVVGDTRTGEVTYLNSYYYMGHFSKFIRPGARRIVSSSNHDDLLTTAFINPDNSIAVVVLNLSDKEYDFDTWVNGQAVGAKSLEHSIMTVMIQ
ncbi:glycoside hydrolase family 30 protein [Limibacter armeniacum]|uniref:glycoside hydrolase family 30 protein n=1 Tax=Limibacter armeniacum TaxID=466084 RepID=UPI002FE51898